MPWFEIISVVVLCSLAWLWFESTRVHEIATEHARATCHAEGVQFLDDTVAIVGLRPARDENGRLALKRIYGFEYSETGINRRPGSIVMLGKEVMFVNVGLRLASSSIEFD